LLNQFLSFFSNKRWVVKEAKAPAMRTYDGPARRIDDLIALMRAASSQSLQCQQLHQRQFFLSLVSQGCTCLLELASDARRVRAFILMLDGRVIGAVLGRRSIPNHVYGRNAYMEALTEFAYAETVLTVSTINNTYALAIAPLLRGEKPSYSCSVTNDISFEQTKSQMSVAKAFGCAFLSADAEANAHTVLYFADGKLLASYSYEKGVFSYSDEGEIIPEPGLVTKQVRKLLMSMQPVPTSGNDKQFQLSDIEGATFTTDISAESLMLPLELLERYSEKSDLVGALTKNRASHRDQQNAIMHTVQNYSVRRASRDHSHKVNPFA